MNIVVVSDAPTDHMNDFLALGATVVPASVPNASDFTDLDDDMPEQVKHIIHHIHKADVVVFELLPHQSIDDVIAWLTRAPYALSSVVSATVFRNDDTELAKEECERFSEFLDTMQTDPEKV